MDPNPLTVDEGTDALDAARRMVAARKGYAVVTRGGPTTIAGIVTEWDFLEKVVAAGRDPASVRLGESASPHVEGVEPDTPTDVVATTMAERGIRRLVVRSGDTVAGVITSRHLVRTFRQYVDKISSEIAGYNASTSPLG